MVLNSNNMDMFSVSVFENYIYWSDRSVYVRVSVRVSVRVHIGVCVHVGHPSVHLYLTYLSNKTLTLNWKFSSGSFTSNLGINRQAQ